MATAAALACIAQDDYVLAAQHARRALTQNPRAGQASRMLAASLALQGRSEEAGDALRRALTIEPELTVTTLRARLRFMPAPLWARLEKGLRRAGLTR